MKTRFLALAIALFLACAFPAAAQSLWGKTTFGMTADQVMAAHPYAHKVDKPNTLKSGARGELKQSGIDIGGTSFDATFFFNPSTGTLQQVSLEPTTRPDAPAGPGVFNTLNEALSAKYGQPVSSENSPNMVGIVRKATWMSDKTNVTLTYLQVGRNAPFITVAYQVRVAANTENL